MEVAAYEVITSPLHKAPGEADSPVGMSVEGALYLRQSSPALRPYASAFWVHSDLHG